MGELQVRLLPLDRLADRWHTLACITTGQDIVLLATFPTLPGG